MDQTRAVATTLPPPFEAWMQSAFDVRAHAHAPYSGFQVGAALLGEDGRVFAGCNVENLSFGLTICAERSAVVQAVAAGVKRFRGIAVVAKADHIITPCGACRQVLAEFGLDLQVTCMTTDGAIRQWTLSELLPESFATTLPLPMAKS